MGNDKEESLKNKDKQSFKSKLSSAIPCNDIIACSINFEEIV